MLSENIACVYSDLFCYYCLKVNHTRLFNEAKLVFEKLNKTVTPSHTCIKWGKTHYFWTGKYISKMNTKFILAGRIRTLWNRTIGYVVKCLELYNSLTKT